MLVSMRDGAATYAVLLSFSPRVFFFQQAIINSTDSNLSNRSISSDHDDLGGRRKRALASPDNRANGAGEN